MKQRSSARVLARYPDAYAHHWADGYIIYAKRADNNLEDCLSSGQWKNARRAWAEAAQRMDERDAKSLRRVHYVGVLACRYGQRAHSPRVNEAHKVTCLLCLRTLASGPRTATRSA